jgi:hypothetical protein
VHLFGHTVQWNVSPSDRALGLLEVRDPSDELLGLARALRGGCGALLLQLFHEAACSRSDQWLANFAACDIAYLMHFYRTGEKRSSDHSGGRSAILILGDSRVHPTKWVARSGTVI